MKQPVLLCYHLPDDTLRKVRLAAMRFKIRVRVVRAWELHIPLGELCALPPSEEAQAVSPGFDDEMLVMCFFAPGLGNAFLQLLRQSKVPPLALKAILTPTNAEWDSVTLHDEIAKERQAILAGNAQVHSEQ